MSAKGMPVISETLRALRGGTSRHCETACRDTPSWRANSEALPTFSIAYANTADWGFFTMSPCMA